MLITRGRRPACRPEPQRREIAMVDELTTAAPPDPAPLPDAWAAAPAPRRWRLLALALALAACGGAGTAAYYALFHDPDREPAPRAAVLPVNTVRPTRTTLVRTLEQPGSILPYAQA